MANHTKRRRKTFRIGRASAVSRTYKDKGRGFKSYFAFIPQAQYLLAVMFFKFSLQILFNDFIFTYNLGIVIL